MSEDYQFGAKSSYGASSVSDFDFSSVSVNISRAFLLCLVQSPNPSLESEKISKKVRVADNPICTRYRI